MKIAVIGSRTCNDKDLVDRYLSEFFEPQDELISGGARGADSLGAEWARSKNYKVTEFIPDWEKYGKSAGFIRNKDIIDNCNRVICFWDGISKGSANSLNIAKKQNKPTIIIYF